MNGPRVLAITGRETGCTLWRTFFPFAELQRRGYFVHWKNKDDPECDDPRFPILMASRFEAIILPRMAWPGNTGERFFSAMRKFGVAVIYEVDDDAFSPGIVPRQYATHEEERAKGLAQLEQDRLDRIACMQQCDGVTVTTRRLKTVVQQYTSKPVEVVPNAIDTRWFRSLVRTAKRVVPPLTIGWAGGARFTEDLIPVAEAWGRIARKRPDVTFVVQGHTSPVLLEAVSEDRLKVLPWLPIESYPQGLVNVDIACCAVAPKMFNTAKTPIKLWEFTLAGAACVVSPTLYGSVTTDGEDALVAETADEWEAALMRLASDAGLRRRLQRAQRRRVAAHHSLERNWQRWPEAWARIIDAFRSRSRLAVA
jgi:glycosyltransferase involved in cell wall biosynthesis